MIFSDDKGDKIMILGIFGAGGNGKMVLDAANNMNVAKHIWSEIIFIDDVIGVSEYHGVKVYKFLEIQERYDSTQLEIVISVGEPEKRELIYNVVCEANYNFGRWIALDSEIDPSVQLGKGVIIGPLAYIGADTVIGNNVLVSRNAVIGHDTIIKDHGIVSAGAFIAGHCVIEERVYVGPVAATIDRLHIGKDSVIGLNAAVYKDVPVNHIALGNPARMIKREEGKGLFDRN